MAIISPSILAADFARLGEELEMINRSEADWLHVDVMDGVFVPNISFGFPLMEAMKKHCTKPLDVHLMIVDPDRYLADFKNAGADWLTVHYEACPHLHRTVQAIHELGMKAGVALNPHTPVSVLKDIIHDLDLVLIMSVNPGFGGQKFIPRAMDKVYALRQMIDRADAKTLIEVDGGVNSTNAVGLRDMGAHALVAGSFVFRSEDPAATIAALRKL